MKPPKVKFEVWMNLYEAAIEYKKLKPWLWMSSDDMFAVKNPEDGEIAYCHIIEEIMGMRGLMVYLGDEGLRSHLEVIQSTEGINLEALHRQKCLMVSFEGRDHLDKEDLRIIRELGYRFRGKNDWPFFRYFEPGYFPWFLNESQARFLTLILQQTIEIAKVWVENYFLLDILESKCPMRYQVFEEGKAVWRDEIIELSPAEEKVEIPVYTNEIKLRSMRKQIKGRAGIWGVEWFHAPSAVVDDDRPYYPVVMLLIETETRSIIDFEVSTKVNLLNRFQEKLIGAMEKFDMLPKEVFVLKRELYEAFEPITDILGIPLRLVKENPILEEIRTGMYQTF